MSTLIGSIGTSHHQPATANPLSSRPSFRRIHHRYGISAIAR